jgi:uncharacterized membrane protein
MTMGRYRTPYLGWAVDRGQQSIILRDHGDRGVAVHVADECLAVGDIETEQRAALPTSNEKWPLQQVLYTYTYRGNPMPGTGTTNTGQYYGQQLIAPLAIQMAVVVLTLVPILLLYPFIQRHFAKGMLLGAIKG